MIDTGAGGFVRALFKENDMLKPALIAALVKAFAPLAHAEEFEPTYDPFKSLGLKQTSPADPDDADQVRRGAMIYAENCAACHGAALEGAEDWRTREEDGAYRPPPHDDSGHTWHHSDKVLFDYVDLGGAELFKDYPEIISNMPGFGDSLTDDDIWAVLAFIKGSWVQEHRDAQAMASQYDPLPEGN